MVVACHWVLYPAIFTSLQVAKTKPGLGFIARNVKKKLPIGREHRTKGTFELVNNVVFVARLAVTPRDAPKRKLHIVGKRSLAHGVIEIFPVRTDSPTPAILPTLPSACPLPLTLS